MALTIEQQVQQLYIGLLGRAADKVGFDYWVAEVTLGNLTIDQVAQSFFDQPETQALYPAGTTNESFVIAAYANVFNRAPDIDGGQYWVGQLNAGLARNVFIEALMNGAVDAATAVPPTFDLSLLTNQTIAAQYYTDSAAATIAQFSAAEAASILVPVTASASSIAASEALTDELASGSVAFTLTTDQDIATASTFNGTLSNYSYDGVGPTLQAWDQLTGASNTANNSLNIIDGFGTASDIMPSGLTLNNIQNITLNTAGNAGQINNQQNPNNPYYNTFNTSTFGSVTLTEVTSSGGSEDSVQASNSSAILVDHNNVSGGVSTYGGSTVNVNSNGSWGVNVGGYLQGSSQTLATGAITVNANGYLTGSARVNVVGGTTVDVNVARATATGDITIGNVEGNLGALGDATTASYNPTSAIVVNSVSNAGAGNVDTIFGGTTVSVTVRGDTVIVGDEATAIIAGNSPTGAVTVTNLKTTTYDGIIGTGHSSVKGGGTAVYGGTNIFINSNTGGDIIVGTNPGGLIDGAVPSGTVTVIDTSSDLNAAYGLGTESSTTTIFGGTNISVTKAGGSVFIGDTTTADTDGTESPSGTVLVNETAASNQSIEINGGNGVTVNAQGQSVSIGAGTGTAGAQVVSQNSVYTGHAAGSSNTLSAVEVDGGTSVLINTTGGDVNVGSIVPANNAGLATGAITINNTFSGALGANASTVDVLGGTTVTITETNSTSGHVNVGTQALLNALGTAIVNDASNASGNITITNSTTQHQSTLVAGAAATIRTVNVYGSGDTNVFTDGGSTVTIAGAGTTNITDVGTVLNNSAKAFKASTLTTASLTGTSGLATVKSNALTTVSLTNSTGGLTVTRVATVAGTETKATALTVNLTANTAGIITDAFDTALTVNALGTALNTASIITTATAINVAATSDFTLGGLTANTAATTLSTSGAGNLDLGDLSGVGEDLVAITSTGSGSLSVTLDRNNTAFTGGTGNSTVTLTALEGTQELNGGSSGANTLVYQGFVDGAGADGNRSNFQTMQLTGATTKGIFNAAGFTTGLVLTGGDLGVTNDDVSFTNAEAGATLTVDAVAGDLVGTGHRVSYALATDTANDTLTAFVGLDGTATTGSVNLSQTIRAVDIENLSVTSLGYVATGIGNTLLFEDSAAKTITLAGDQNTTVDLKADNGSDLETLMTVNGGTNSAVTTLTATGSGDVDFSNVANVITGVTVQGGTGVITAHGTLGANGAVGGSDVVQNSETITISGGWGVGDTVAITINGIVSTYEVVAEDVGADLDLAVAQHNVAVKLAALINTTSDTSYVTAVADGSTVVYTGVNPGVAIDLNTPDVTNSEATSIETITPAEASIAQVNLVSISTAGSDIGSTVTVTINGTEYTYTTLEINESAESIAIGLESLLGTATEVIVTALGDSFTLTAVTAGTPFSSSIVSSVPSISTSDVVATENVVGVAQVDTFTVSGGFGIGSTVTETINGTDYTYTVLKIDMGLTSADTLNNVAQGLAAELNSSGVVTATVDGAVVTVTGNPGVTFTDVGAVTSDSAEVVAANPGVDIVHNFTDAIDTLTTGAGGGVLTIGTGGGWNGVRTIPNYDSGSETINLTASTAIADTLVVHDGAVSTFNSIRGGVTNFVNAGNYVTSDELSFANTTGDGLDKTALTNVTTATIVRSAIGDAGVIAADVLDTTGALGPKLNNLAYTINNGVITFSGTGIFNLSDFTKSDLINAAQLIANYAVGLTEGSGGANKVVTFNSGLNSYVVTSADGTITQATNNDSVIELLLGAGVKGFGTTAAANTIRTVDSNNTFGGVVYTNAGTTIGASATVSATVTAAGTFYDQHYTVSTNTASTLNNLSGSAQVDLVNASGTLTVVQNGTAGQMSLTLANEEVDSNQTLSTVTVTGDNYLQVDGNLNSTTITSLVDGSAIDTLATIALTGELANFTLAAITDTALTLIQASAVVGNVTLGSGTALSQAGLTITLSGGADTISVSGDGDILTLGNGDNTVTVASGNNTIITGGSDRDTVTAANGANNIINLGDGVNVITAANGAGTQITTGAGDDTVTAANGLGAIISLGDGINTLVSATGAGDHITAGDGNNTLTNINGAGDIITLGNGDNTFIANGAADIITVGTGTNTIHANGVGNTFNVGTAVDTGVNTIDGGLAPAGATFGHFGIGANSTVNVGQNGNGTTVYLTGDLTGGTSANYNFTTIGFTGTSHGVELFVGQYATDNVTGLTASFINGENHAGITSQVNVAELISLSAALDLAASTASQSQQVATQLAGPIAAQTSIIDWFQFGGDTYIVEVNNPTSNALAQTGLDANDMVVKIVGLVDLSTAVLDGSNLSLNTLA